MTERAKILVVDDDPDVLDLLRLMLEAEGFSPITAADGRAGLGLIRSERPDVVLLDLMMPVLDGWGVLEGLASEPHQPRVLVVSAKSGDADRARAFELGASGYLSKPFSPDGLIQAIESVLANPGRAFVPIL